MSGCLGGGREIVRRTLGEDARERGVDEVGRPRDGLPVRIKRQPAVSAQIRFGTRGGGEDLRTRRSRYELR